MVADFRELDALRYGPVLLADPVHTSALKARLVERLQAVLASTPQRLRRQRSLRRRWMAAAVVSLTLVCVLPWLLDRASDDLLDVEPLEGAQLVWSGATTELRRVSAADRVPARGKLAVLGEQKARLVLDQVVVELDGHTRVSLEAARRPAMPGVELEQGGVRCFVSQSDGTESFTVSAGVLHVSTRHAVFSVSRLQNPSAEPCVRVESGTLELRHADRKLVLATGQSFGCSPL